VVVFVAVFLAQHFRLQQAAEDLKVEEFTTLISSLRQTSSMPMPRAWSSPAVRSFLTICSGVCRFFFMMKVRPGSRRGLS